MTTGEFIQKAKAVHGDKYDYSKVEYVNNKTKVCIICPKHGEFTQVPHNHLLGQGCSDCAREKYTEKRTHSLEDFIEAAKAIHGNKYDYSHVVYVNAHTNVCIICPVHGEFWQRPSHHLGGHGCSKCATEKNAEKIRPHKTRTLIPCSTIPKNPGQH